MMSKKIIIVGAGIGGLSAACKLAHEGYDVTVLEKHSKAGGRNGQIEKNGYSFDIGASYIMAKEIYEDYFHSMGLNLKDFIDMKPLKETSRFFFNGKEKFHLSSNRDLVRQEIINLYPGDEVGFDKYVKLIKEVHDLLYTGPKMARRNFHKLKGLDYLFDTKVIKNLHKFNLQRSWGKTVKSLFKSTELQIAFSYQSMFMGMKPDEALGVYVFLSWFELFEGIFTIKGGVYEIIKGFMKLAKLKGVKFEFNTEVQKLNYDGETIISVDTNRGQFEADIFVSNVDGAYFYTHLMPPEKNKSFTNEKVKKMKHTSSFFTINLGLKHPIKELGHHNVILSNNRKENFDLIFEQKSAPKFNFENTSYYICQPTVSDDSVAPNGKGLIFILVPVCGYDPDFDWKSYEDTFKNFVYDMIEQREGIQIRDLIEEEIVFSPDRWGKEYNLWENITLGFSHNFTQVNNFRMPNKSKEFNNLYFTGTSTIPGAGMPTCITSGELVSERINEDFKDNLEL